MAPALNWDDLTQTAALPLGSWLKTDPWDDKVQMLDAKRYAPMNARDKMPFEVTPIFYKLQHYDLAKADAPAAAPDATAATPDAPAAAPPADSQSAPAAAPVEGAQSAPAPAPAADKPGSGTVTIDVEQTATTAQHPQ
jgi:hypothetical protein